MKAFFQAEQGLGPTWSGDSSAAGQRGRILLLEGDVEVRESLRRALQSEGYQVRAVSDETAALDQVREGQIQVIVLDLSCREGNGWQLFDHLSALNRLLPVIVTTARGDQAETGRLAGAAAVLEKPLYLPALIDVIERLLQEPLDERLRRIREVGRGVAARRS